MLINKETCRALRLDLARSLLSILLFSASLLTHENEERLSLAPFGMVMQMSCLYNLINKGHPHH